MTQGIYKIIRGPKIYIGSSKNLERRLRTHFRELSMNKHDNPYMQSDYNSHSEQFDYGIVEVVQSVDDLLDREQYYIDLLFANIDRRNIFNANPIASKPPSALGLQRSEETKAKMSKAQIGKRYAGKTYVFRSPSGDIVEVSNLYRFCMANDLNNGHMVSVALGNRKQHKGWTAA